MTFADTSLYTAKSDVRSHPRWAPKGKDHTVWGWDSSSQSCPEALGSPTGCVVRPGHGLLWPHPSHSPAPGSLSSSSARSYAVERVPNLSGASFRACHPQYPGGPVGCIRLFLPQPLWSSSLSHRLDIRISHARWFPRGVPHEAESGSLALRPARWLALHQQGLLLPSFRRPGRPETASVMTT